jgi:acylphosphatase
MQIARHLIISGRVQGVGFRQFMVRTAEALDIKGWVRNRNDGTVEAVVAGSQSAVESMIERTRRGPRHAAVRDLQIAEVQGIFKKFEMLATL